MVLLGCRLHTKQATGLFDLDTSFLRAFGHPSEDFLQRLNRVKRVASGVEGLGFEVRQLERNASPIR